LELFLKGGVRVCRSRTVREAKVVKPYQPTIDLADKRISRSWFPAKEVGSNNTPEFGTGTHRR